MAGAFIAQFGNDDEEPFACRLAHLLCGAA